MTAKSALYQRVPPTAIAFRPEFLDFDRGIRVGHLEDNERITRLLKLELEYRYRQPFITERWGRGVYWQWIGYLPKANRTAKPLSASVSFGCSKLFLSVDTEERLFQCGLQIERGYLKAPPEYRGCELRSDWDWHRLLKSLKRGSLMESEIRRLVRREGFNIHAGSWETFIDYGKANLPAVLEIRRLLQAAPGDHWAGFQLYYSMPELEVRTTTGLDLVEAMLAIFDEVTPAMNLCMQIHLDQAL
ncbi:MAG: hypothetical protein LAP85_13125 [Acidobacteriia bacterium]|nr:hypothetical protein [Terriglobia bacterium]